MKNIRLKEIHVIRVLYPVFRRYIHDRKRSGSDNGWDYQIESNGEKAVSAFVDLGPTFIKLGQILSARPDLLPKEYLNPFRKLQDSVTPDPFDSVRATVEKYTGDIEKTFDSFDKEAISGASLGQVYRAVYKGEDVAIKVNRVGIEDTLKEDLTVLKRLLKLAKGRMDNFLYISIENVILDFNRRIFDEIDYRKEAENMDRIRKNLRGYDKVAIPEVISELSGKEVLTMKYVHGIKIDDIAALDRSGIDRKDLAFRTDLIFMRMLLKNDIFHADPHPGNLSVMEDGTLIIYDFGMVGYINDDMRFRLLSLYDGLVNRDSDEIIDTLLALNALSPAANRGIIRNGIEMAMSNFYGKSVDELEVRELLDVANDVIFQFPFRLPRTLVLYMRMTSILEGLCKELDPEFKFIKILQKILYDEGMLQDLYKKQLENFFSESLM
ncbi:MAG: ABC1 kinase family protein, partial [Thermoplasmata archaeon]